MKNIFLVIGVIIIIGGLVFLFGGASFNGNGTEEAGETSTSQESVSVVTSGTYTVDPAQSEFEWAGQKPLIDGYVNSGTIDITEGTISVGDSEASGSFVLDMNTLRVGLTAQKPGQEGALEGHLKNERWFDVASYPTAEFVITNVTPTADSDATFEYTVTGDLTFKGTTNEISFPARIYQSEDGLLHAEAVTEINRTRWGLTSGSGNFFENLGDNLVADEVAISFSVVATLAE